MNANAQSNPLLREWNTPFGVPPFNEIADEHFLPALKAGIDEQRREVQAISANPEPPTFANTIEALDASGELLDKVYAVFSNLTSAETNDRLQEVARQVAPMRAALQDDILLDQRLFARVKAVWEKRDELNLNAEQRKLLEETYKDFVRGGANLSEDHKKRF
ncbi:MAG TPA: hypothetical protein PLK67_08515, partial [Bryobacteraceae bacterium]|nr:hypothetical protein [Bryobacteraceae bacterium]